MASLAAWEYLLCYLCSSRELSHSYIQNYRVHQALLLVLSKPSTDFKDMVICGIEAVAFSVMDFLANTSAKKG